MPLDLVTVPCLTDNFAFIVKGDGDGEVVLIDAPEAGPIIPALEQRGWHLGAILITHHHHDHVGGVAELRDRYGAKVVGPAAEAAKLPALDRAVRDGDTGGKGAFRSVVIDVPGHTLGHVAYHFPEAGLLFTGDSLMAAGCGRLFEGTPAQMWASLCRLMALPPETLVCSGHDYLNGNLAFAASVDPANEALASRTLRLAQMRRDGLLPMPSLLSEELATNPFLRAALPELAAAAGQTGAAAVEVFTALRALKDGFR